MLPLVVVQLAASLRLARPCPLTRVSLGWWSLSCPRLSVTLWRCTCCGQSDLSSNPRKKPLDLGGGIAARFPFLCCLGGHAGVFVGAAMMDRDRGNIAVLGGNGRAGVGL